MQVIDSPDAVRAWTRAEHPHRVALVPTMGALHDGHLSLVRLAREHAERVVVSIFVNPLQFDRRDDFERYPQPFDADLEACRAAGVDAVYAPTAHAMYPEGFQTTVEPGALAEPLEGGGRPGHFRGVATVVTKLLNAVQPDVAVFGQKDFQQLAVITRMVRDLDMGVTIVAGATVREHDGLAMSSRNRRLSSDARAGALVVPGALGAIEAAFRTGERDVTALLRVGRAIFDAEPRARVEYLSIDDAVELTPLRTVDRRAVVSTAVWFDDVRLIDNVVLSV